MKILVLGGGGREHALVWAIAQNPKCQKIFCAPGNAGINKIATHADLNILKPDEIVDFCKNKAIDFVVIGPEAPLLAGVSDALRLQNILTFGPSKEASMLEASKSFTKEICRSGNIPTAISETFYDFKSAKTYLERSDYPIVVKADGLAAGKGVVIAESKKIALNTIESMLSGRFGVAGDSLIIEEFLPGEELSYFVLCDGKTLLPIGSAQDHKRAFDGDRGPNTGGMGAYSPAPTLTKALEKKILSKIIKPTIDIMNSRGSPFLGVLYAGLMIKDGEPSLIEYNVRFGDPECQVLMVRLGAQILDVLLDCAEQKLNESRINWANDSAISVVMATKGYPANYKKGTIIKNISSAEKIDGVEVFHAGTKTDSNEVLANGGRVLNITCRESNLKLAHKKVYQAAALIDWTDGFYRNDIGWRGLK
ncbi:MAG: phosphoribosylamine--glycine ligase [Paracoccaceae bacterium]|nr:phosphoribosylamine--glycine ligase [Paracoccaceae bacterium]